MSFAEDAQKMEKTGDDDEKETKATCASPPVTLFRNSAPAPVAVDAEDQGLGLIRSNDIRFSSSPNWYCSKVIDSDGCRLLAFGSRNNVVLLDVDAQAARATSKLVPPEAAGTRHTRPLIAVRVLHRLHSERVSGVCFNYMCGRQPATATEITINAGRLLATVGDDLVVNVVDVDSQRLMSDEEDLRKGYKLICHHKEHKAKIAAVTWATIANKLAICVLSGDEKGSLIAFNVVTSKLIVYKPQPVGNALTCLAACPSNASLVAVGYQDGLIVVIDLKMRGHVLWCLRHHDKDIQSLCWAPFVGLGPLASTFDRIETAEESDDRLFISSSKDRTFRIWSTKQGAPIRTFQLPAHGKGGSGRQRSGATGGDDSKVSPWLTAHWSAARPHTILAGSHLGDLMTFDLRSADRENHRSVVGIKEGKGHLRTIFNIISCQGMACTVSMDRQIIFWDMQDTEPDRWLLSMPTLGGYVYSLTFSPVNAGIMAIGCGDNMIRTWNTTSTSNPYEMQTFWQGIKSKVTALSWHPRKEGILAFGTSEGRVAIYNVLSNKQPLLSKNFHRKVVYTLTWGPVCPRTDDQVGQWRLYSCGDGTILVHDHSNLDKSALNLDKIISANHPSRGKVPSRTDVAFKPDYSILILGNDDGTVELCDVATLTLRVVVCAPRKLVQCLRWHPEFTTSSSTQSSCCFWLAIASRDFTVHVHDLKDHLAIGVSEETSIIPVPKKSSPSFELAGHRSAVATIAWSPHKDGQLVSASFDGTVRVWNVKTMEMLACFCGHAGRVLCAEWNPLDPDLVASGGEDFTLRMWKVSEQSRFELPRSRRVKLSKVQIDNPTPAPGSFIEAGEKADSPLGGDVVGELKELLEQRRREILELEGDDDGRSANCACSGVDSKANSIQGKDSPLEWRIAAEKLNAASPGQPPTQTQVNKKAGTSKKRKRAFKSMFPVSNTRENQGGKATLLNDCLLMADRISSGSDENSSRPTDDLLSLGAYGGRIDAYRLVKMEGEHHCKNDNDEYAMQLDLWKGNVAGAIRSAAAKDQLSDWQLAMASIVSHGFWAEMCDLYSKQLVTNGQPHKAVTYLLANQNVRGAIEVLKANVSYKEAIILAKIRLPSDDPLIEQLMEEWAAHMEREGQAEQAAKCYLSLGRVEKAATVLAQRQDAPSLRTAAFVMRRCRSEDAPKVADDYAARAAYEYLVIDDHKMAETVVGENLQLNPFLLVIEAHKLLKDSLVNPPVCKLGEPNCDHDCNSLLEKVHRKWLVNCSSFIEDSKALNEAISLLTKDSFPPNPLQPPQTVAYLATWLTHALILALNSQYKAALKLLLKVVRVLLRIGDIKMLAWFYNVALPDPRGSPDRFFSFLKPDDDDDAKKNAELCGLIESLGVYHELVILKLVVKENHLMHLNACGSDEQVILASNEASRAQMIAIGSKLMSSVLLADDLQSDAISLKVQLDDLKTSAAILLSDDLKTFAATQTSEERMDADEDLERKERIAIEILEVSLLSCLSKSNNGALRIGFNRIKELMRITEGWADQATELIRLLVVTLKYLEERDTAWRSLTNAQDNVSHNLNVLPT